MRDLTRYRKKLVQQVTADKNRFLKILEDCNIKLSMVLSNVFGASGSKMVNHILSVESYHPEQMMQYVHGKVKASREDIKEALTGYITDHHKFMLQTILGNIAKTKNTYFSSKYKSLVGRRGKKKAIIALGHKILIAAYFIIKNKVEYKELGEDYLDNFRKDKLIAYYKKQIERLDPNLHFDKEEAA